MKKKEAMPSHHGVDETLVKDYPNETLRLLNQRASCRSFSVRKIPRHVLDLVLEAGIHAPSGGNLQPYSIIKIEEAKTKEKLAQLCGNQTWIAQAPTNLLFCIDWHRLKRWAEIEIAPFTATKSFRHFWISFLDTIIAAQNICTASDFLGLGSVYIGTVIDCLRELRTMFQLPEGVLPVVLLALGYPKARPKPKRKLGVEVIAHNEKYQQFNDKMLKQAFDKKYPDLKVEITEERLEKISEVCRRVHGEAFAQKCTERIKENGYINPVQRYFGLHYQADMMPKDNDEFLKIMEESGFACFKKYQTL
jgi:nitroreductase